MDTSRVALITYRLADGEQRYAGSGLLISDRQVLTADHVASGHGHVVQCVGGAQAPVRAILRSDDPAVDLAILTLAEPLGRLDRLTFARIDRGGFDQVGGCVAVGFPRWQKRNEHRYTAQVSGHIPTSEGLDPAGGSGAGCLTLIGDRNPQAPPGFGRELHEQSPSPWGGMSGAGVVVGDAVIGVVRSVNLAAGGQSLTVTPLTAIERLPESRRQLFWDALGVRELRGLSAFAPQSLEWALSEDVRQVHLPLLRAALGPAGVPGRWTLRTLSELRGQLEGDDALSERLSALCCALEAKPVFSAIGGGRLGLGQLQVIYRREIAAWPTGWSADALLAEAASVNLAECRSGPRGPLRGMGRFMIGVAAALGVAPQDSPLLAGWLEAMGHQLADATAHYRDRADSSAWLLIDLGDEPRKGLGPWPEALSWVLLAADDVIASEPVRCDPSADGLRQALAAILRLMPPARPLLVDLAVPRALMDEGIEHWPVVDVDGCEEPLSVECRPRLRWSRRRRDTRLYNRVLTRLEQASWDGDARHWVQSDPRYACFIGGHETHSPEDQLRMLLREGHAFAFWFASGLPASALPEIGEAFHAIPVDARREVLPDYLPRFGENGPAVIWDDPRGRGRFGLPPLVVPESP